MGRKPIHDVLQLDERLFLGQGADKRVYIHPLDSKKCIKILRHPERKSRDLMREMSYRRSLKFQGRKSALLTQYYGTVNTNRGTGYVFERLVNFDGSMAVSMKDFFKKQNMSTPPTWRLSSTC